MSRTVILLGLTQALVVVLVFFALATIFKYHGYPNEPFQVGSSFGVYHWSNLSLFLRTQGFFLLLLPIVWTVFTTVAEARAKFIFPLGLWLVIGTILPCLIMATFFLCSFSSLHLRYYKLKSVFN